MLLQVENMRVKYGPIVAVKNLSLHLDEGEIITIIGANGAGKTSTLKAISGTKEISSGKIHFRGERIDTTSPERIVAKGISHVPEGRKIFAHMNVTENLRMGAFLKPNLIFKKNLESIFTIFPRLKERARQDGGSLSGGEQQMLAIARALIAEPKLMLLDEPTLGLSPQLVRETAETIKNIIRGGVSCVLVEQNAFVALRLSSRTYCLEAGKLVLEGLSKDLLNMEYIKRAYLGG
jgi:branched-chain amino acid transport system ATP-binding protein